MKHIWLGNGCLYAPGSKLLLGMVIPPFIKNPWVCIYIYIYGYINTLLWGCWPSLSQSTNSFLPVPLSWASTCSHFSSSIGLGYGMLRQSPRHRMDHPSYRHQREPILWWGLLVHPYFWDPPLFWTVLWSSSLITTYHNYDTTAAKNQGKVRMLVR